MTQAVQDQPAATCGLCGQPILHRRDMTREHLRPVSRGGEKKGKNVVPAHRWCNQEKGDRTLGEYRAGVMSPRQTKDSLSRWRRRRARKRA